MYNYSSIFHQLYQYIGEQHQKIEVLKREIQSIKDQLQDMKKKPVMNVEKMEYRFDQLKVDTLEGTLNIGMNPADTAEMADMALPFSDQSALPPIEYAQLLLNTYAAMNEYINNELPDWLRHQEVLQKRKVEPSVYSVIKTDLAKQLPERIQFYIQQLAHRHKDSSLIQQEVLEKTKLDIQQAIVRFLTSMPDQKGGTFNEPPSQQS
jgi:spore germination protein PC